MSNIFTRARYDPEELKRFDRTNTRSYEHTTDLNNYENKNNCVNPNMPSQNGSLSRPLNTEGFLNKGSQAEIENKLRNLHLELNNNKERNNQDYLQVSRTEIEMCETMENKVNNESNFNDNIRRGISTTLLVIGEVPLYNPIQQAVIDNDNFNKPTDRMGISTRISAKSDNYTNSLKASKRQAVERAGENTMNRYTDNVSALLPTSQRLPRK